MKAKIALHGAKIRADRTLHHGEPGVLPLAYRQHAPAVHLDSPHAVRHVRDPNGRHPLQQQTFKLGLPLPEADDGDPGVVQKVPPPQGLRPRAQHLRVKPHFPLVFGHGDSGVPRQDPCARQRKGCCTLPFPSGKGSLNVAARRHPSRPLWLCKDVHSELLRLTIPTIISTLAVPLLGMVDTAVLGRLPDVNQLAGAAAAGIILNVVMQMFFFLRMGTTALVAQQWGAGNPRGAALVLFQSLTLAAVFGFLLVVFRRPIAAAGFALVGAEPGVTAVAHDYFSIRILEAPFYLMTLALTALMRGQGDALVPMYVVIGVNAVNVVGDLLLVPGTWGLPSLGAVGAAWASVAAQAAGWAAAFWVGWRRIRTYWDWTWLRRWRQLPWRRFFAVQSHLFVRTLVLVLTFSAVTSLAARLESATLLAAHAILMQFWQLVSYAVDGFAFATETTVGSWLGRGERHMAHASATAALLWGVGLGTLFGVAYFFFVDDFAVLFTHNEDVLAVVVSLVWAVAVSQPINAAAYIFDGILIGATDTRYLRNAMLLSTAVFAFIIAAGWMTAGLSLPLIWWAMLVFMGMRALTLGLRFRSGAWMDHGIVTRRAGEG